MRVLIFSGLYYLFSVHVTILRLASNSARGPASSVPYSLTHYRPRDHPTRVSYQFDPPILKLETSLRQTTQPLEGRRFLEPYPHILVFWVSPVAVGYFWGISGKLSRGPPVHQWGLLPSTIT